IAESMDHNPDFDIRYNTIRMRVVSHDVGGLTDRDTKFAAELDKLIDGLQLKRQPQKIGRTHLVIVTPDTAAILPFWKAVHDVKESGGDEQRTLLVVRSDVLDTVSFHQ